MKGFTLVEMLVALLVFSLLSAAGVAVLYLYRQHIYSLDFELPRPPNNPHC